MRRRETGGGDGRERRRSSSQERGGEGVIKLTFLSSFFFLLPFPSPLPLSHFSLFPTRREASEEVMREGPKREQNC